MLPRTLRRSLPFAPRHGTRHPPRPLAGILQRPFPPLPSAVYALVALACVGAKLALCWFDHGVLIHSDSGNYVLDAFTLRPGWPRPLAYGCFLRLVFELFGARLGAAALAQSILGAGLGVGTFALAERFVGAPRSSSALAAAVVTVSPLVLVMERYVLADSLGLLALLAALAALHVFVRRPTAATALILAVGSVLPALVRTVWVVLPPLIAALATVGVWVRASDKPGREGRGSKVLRRSVGWAAAALLLAVALLVSYGALFSARTSGEVDLATGGNGFTGWVLWASVARFAEPDDLRGFAHADVLLSDPESLRRNGNFQIWDFGSTAHRLRQESFGGSFVLANRALLEAAVRVALRHPIGFAGQLATSLGKFFTPTAGNNDYSGVVSLDAVSTRHIERELGPGAAPAPRQPPRFGPALRAWRWLRWLWSGALFVALAVGLRSPRQHFPALALGTVGVAYLLVVNAAVAYAFVERYFLPVEYLGVLAGTALAATFSTRRASSR